MFVKICGITSVDDARLVVESGADALGVIMSDTSRRGVEAARAGQIASAVSGRITTVLVTNTLPAAEAAALAGELGFSVLQLHGPAYARSDFAAAAARFGRLWRATSLSHTDELDPAGWHAERLLLDAPRAGSGTTWDLSALESRRPAGDWLLAGGLHPGNVADAIRAASPAGVDVASGVEASPGVKDPEKVRAFVAAARAAQSA